MRKNVERQYYRSNEGRIHFDGDWFGKGLPGNVNLKGSFYFSSSMGFERVHSKINPCLIIGNEVGLYDQFGLEIGSNGVVEIDDYAIISGSRLVCNERITIGKYCMVSWSTYITDSWIRPDSKRDFLKSQATDYANQRKHMPFVSPVVLKDNVWIGFGCVIMPGVTIGEGAVVSSKTIVSEDVAPYTVVAGSPMRVVKKLSK